MSLQWLAQAGQTQGTAFPDSIESQEHKYCIRFCFPVKLVHHFCRISEWPALKLSDDVVFCKISTAAKRRCAGGLRIFAVGHVPQKVFNERFASSAGPSGFGAVLDFLNSC